MTVATYFKDNANSPTGEPEFPEMWLVPNLGPEHTGEPSCLPYSKWGTVKDQEDHAERTHQPISEGSLLAKDGTIINK